MPHTRALIAEAIGTFALCFVGILAIAHPAVVGGDPGGLAAVAFAHGLIIAVMVAALAHHSGAHFNPAVTFGFLVTRRMDPVKGALYVAAQLVGATLASGLIAAMFDVQPVIDGTPLAASGMTAPIVIVSEAVATFFLVLVIFGSAVDERAPASVFPLAIGLTITACILAIGPITGAALNPARVLGPALVGGVWDGHWTYWVGPLLGGGLAGLLQDRVLLARAPSPAVAEHGGPAPAERRD